MAERLRGRGAALVVCTATAYGGELLSESVDVRVHTGRMGAQEMAAFFEAERFELVVDATHPYADLATENIQSACAETKIEYVRLQRESGAENADGVWAADAAACIEYLKSTQGNIFLTTGSKDLPLFCADEALRDRLYVRVLPMQRSLEICADCGIAPERIIAMQGPFDEELNAAMFRAANAKYVVTKDTGGAGGYADKIRAARKVGAQAVIIGRPRQAEGMAFEALAQRLEEKLNLKPRHKMVSLVGMGMGDAETRTLGAQRAMDEADCLIGSKRMLELVDVAGRACHAAVLARDIAQIIREDGNSQSFVVLLSGDTGFYSGAKKLLEALGDMDVAVLPGIGSLSYFCAKLRRPWENVRAISLHGRDGDLVREVRTHEAVFTLLGGEHGVHDALRRLCAAQLGSVCVYIGERLGYAQERIVSGMAEELLEGTYDPLSVMLIENPKADEVVVTHGLPDDDFERDETPMTKEEVRSVILSKLRLTRSAVVYDVGSGSGSVSVEAALQANRGTVYAIEMKESAAALTKRNADRFGPSNLHVILGKAPDALQPLPAPTHAFIGGSSGNMAQIIECLLEKNPAVRIVASAVTLETVAELTEISKSFVCSDIAEISVSKPRTLGRYRLMTAQNPVYVFTMQGKKEIQEG